MRTDISIKEAVRFHGHLGPWLVLGVLAGKLALKKLRAKKYFGLNVKVYGANQKPSSCLIDGLQLGCGATYGKGNIQKLNSRKLKIIFLKNKAEKKLTLTLKDNIIKKLNQLTTHQESEIFAKKLYYTDAKKLFNIY